jgi:hypothetical protein
MKSISPPFESELVLWLPLTKMAEITPGIFWSLGLLRPCNFCLCHHGMLSWPWCSLLENKRPCVEKLKTEASRQYTQNLLPVMRMGPVFLFSSRVWTQGLVLAKQVIYNVSHASNPFCFRYFLDRVLCLCSEWPGPWASHFLPSWDDRHTPPHPDFINWNVVSRIFSLRLNPNCYPPDHLFLRN